jgi:hypothetical protein
MSWKFIVLLVAHTVIFTALLVSLFFFADPARRTARGQSPKVRYAPVRPQRGLLLGNPTNIREAGQIGRSAAMARPMNMPAACFRYSGRSGQRDAKHRRDYDCPRRAQDPDGAWGTAARVIGRKLTRPRAEARSRSLAHSFIDGTLR